MTQSPQLPSLCCSCKMVAEKLTPQGRHPQPGSWAMEVGIWALGAPWCCGPGPVRFGKSPIDRHPMCTLQVPSRSIWGCFPGKKKKQFCSLIFQCGKGFTAPGECHIPTLQLLPARPPPHPSTQNTQPCACRERFW